jgi:hypothetical protein
MVAHFCPVPGRLFFAPTLDPARCRATEGPGAFS